MPASVNTCIQGQQYVVFSLNSEMYALDAMQVQEIVELAAVTHVPHLPLFLKGVINLRGTIIPVVDLKLKFGMQSEGYRKHTCVVVTEFTAGTMGLIVDTVSDVLFLEEERVTAPPSFGIPVRTDFIRGMGRQDKGLIIILDLEKVLSQDEIALLGAAEEEGRLPADFQKGDRV